MQRQLFVTQVVTDHFREKLLGTFAQCQLDRALQVVLIRDRRTVQTMFGQQLAIDQYMILRWVAVTQLFQVGADQTIETRIAPMLKQTVQPGAVHQFGRADRLEEKQCVCLVAEKLAWATLLARAQVFAVLARHVGTVLLDEPLQGRKVPWQFIRQAGGVL
ncbi:hypothetical protein D3C73_952830 [compost metagenome]